MQLPVTGHPLHTRSLTTVTHMRADGRLQARGDVNDLRKCGFVPMVGGIQPAGIIHQMSIDLVLDPASRRIDELVVDQPFVAIEPSEWTAGECCRDPAVRLQELVGEPVDGSLTKKLSGVFGGPRGCSHLLTLFQLMASALPRAMDREEALVAELGVPRKPGERLFWRSAFVDGYEAEDGAIEIAVQLHDFHGRPVERPANALDRFARHEEVRVFARVESPSWRISEVHAFERTREGASLATAEWTDRSGRVAPLVGGPVIPGLAGRIFACLPEGPETAVLRDALLQLAPGQIQIMAAITDRWFARMRDAGAADATTSDPGPPVGSLGGMADSCWMWRREGPLGRMRAESIVTGSDPEPA
ncbi:MAG: DUF2889 domain-containing protein [Myxococcota bacterium]